MIEAFICDAVRTPIGRYGGVLAGVRTDDLAAVPIAALVQRNPGVDWQAVDDVVLGCANQAGEDNRNLARMAALLAGLPVDVPGVTVNRLCGSGLDAVAIAARQVRSADAVLPPPWRAKVPVVPVIRLNGTVGSVTPLRTGLALSSMNDVLERAFQRRGIAAVALSINSPGGSAVQASLIAARIRALAARHELRVLSFVEDVAASGGYWLACAGDEIYADSSSIVGSIGVVSAGFGFVEAIRKLGIERRVHTAGENKAILDPFRPERPEDVERLKALQLDVHEEFKTVVRDRRAGRLKEDHPDLFTGAFWSGRRALELGLIDGIGSMHQILKERYGEEVVLKVMERSQALWWRRLFPFGNPAPHEAVIEAIETRILMGRFGL